MDPIKVAIVGAGYWGQNLIRNFWEQPDSELALVCDLEPKLLATTKRRYPTLQVTNSFDEVLKSNVDGVVLATPVSTHHPFAKQALQAGKHVLVEKPLATTTSDVLDLIETAEKHGRVLMTDHTFVYTGAVRRMKQLVETGEVGQLLYYDSVRVNLGLIQNDTNVLWDLGPHDFSIMDFISGQDPISVSAFGAKHMGCPFETLVYVGARFDSDLVAHVHLNWLAPVKVRRTMLGGSNKLVVYDDMEPTEKIKIYDRGLTVNVNHDPERRTRLLAGYRNGDMVAPNLDMAEALRLMAREFVTAIGEHRPALTDGIAGYRIVRILEAAQKSLENNGQEIKLGPSAFARAKAAAQG